MKIRYILQLTLFLFFHVQSNAQKDKIWGNPQVVQRFVTEARKNPAYKKFKSDLDDLLKNAKGSNTNFESVKQLFSNNSVMFNELYARSNIQTPNSNPSTRRTKYTAVKINSISALKDKLKLVGQEMEKTVTPPFTTTWRWTDQGGGMLLPDTSMSVHTNGKAVMVFQAGTTELKQRLGGYRQGFFQTFTVPNNPAILAAEIKIEYSYLYTAWDTYGGTTGLELYVRSNDKFISPDLKSLPASDRGGYPFTPSYITSGSGYDVVNQNNDTMRVMSIIHPMDTIKTEIGEWHNQEENGSYTMSGYVYPGSTIKLDFGIGYMLKTYRGLNGNYHYLEFRLKKITINYFKQGE